MKICVLISCMNQLDMNIIQKTNVQTDVVCINQCDRDEESEFLFKNKKGEMCQALFICTKERGLSRSRNMAIEKATGDICLICDDDEQLVDNYAEKIEEGYALFPTADFIAFAFIYKDGTNKKHPSLPGKMALKELLRTVSRQCTFRRSTVMDNAIRFDNKMGSGTGNGCSEEIKFMMDFRRRGLKMYIHPNVIGVLFPSESHWFNGYNKNYLINLGWSSRRALGSALGFAYIMYYSFSHQRLYKYSFMKCLLYLIKGFFQHR